jgi:hypothetical protein
MKKLLLIAFVSLVSVFLPISLIAYENCWWESTPWNNTGSACCDGCEGGWLEERLLSRVCDGVVVDVYFEERCNPTLGITCC